MSDRKSPWYFTSISALAAIPVPLPVKISGPTGKGLNTCGGTMWKQNREQVIRTNGKTRIFTKEAGKKMEIRSDLKGAGKFRGLKVLFHNTNLPVIDNYYEPWTYQYDKLFDAPEGDDQPTAEPVSLITGEKITPKAGPNWDDDLGGTPDYARNDVNLKNLSQAEQEAMFQLERMTMFYLPRICNHCLNPACVAACPSGAIYKRGEDGIVLINQKKCRAWRLCVTACPYKKVYYNWNTGNRRNVFFAIRVWRPVRLPACMHSCVGRIRYLGVLLYDADRIERSASC